MGIIPKYVIDTCSLVTLKRVYPPDVVPGAWDAISQLADSGIMISSHEIYLEIEGQEDGVFEWAKTHHPIFLPLEKDIQVKATEILTSFPNLLDLRQAKSSADPFLIATAIVKSCVVVTEEQPSGPGSKLIKIPNVCRLIDVGCINLLEMLRREGVRLEIKKES